nr:reverse transcriptase domain-containing protein [Tanacetum cinerariifolium]
MQTRSSSRLVSDQSSNPTSSMNPNPKGRNRRRSKQRIENFNLEENSPPVVTMADQRTMAQLLEAPTEGYEDLIVVPSITTDNFELKPGLLTLIQNKQFYGHDKEDPHAHIRYFNKITSTLKFPNVLNTSIKLMLFPFYLEGAAQIWLEREPPRLIFTWDDLVSKFINQFFSPSKTTSLRNEITNFQQRCDESFSKAWDRFKDLIRDCPHHGFSELHQHDTFYNALNSKDQDSLNSTAGGNFLDKMPRECLAIIESKSKVCYSRDKPVVAKVITNASTSSVSPDVAELKYMVKALLLDKKGQNQSPAPVKAVKESCVTCGGPHSYRKCPAIDGNIYRDNIQEFAPAYQALAPQTQSVSKEDFSAYVKANDAVMKNMQTQGQNMQNQLTNPTDLIMKFVNSNTASTSSSVTLPSNTIANPKSDLKAITTRSVNPTNNGNTEDVQPQAVQFKSPVSISKPVTEPKITPVSALKPNPKASIPYPSRRNDERNREKANNQIKKFYQIFKDMSFEIRFADALILMPKFASTLKALIGNKEKLSEMARTLLNEHCSAVLLKKLPKKLGDPGKFLISCDLLGMAECLALVDLGASINLMPFSVWKRLYLPDFTPTYMTLELADHSISHPVEVAEDVYVKTGRALIDVFEGELTLRVGKEAITFNLDQTLRYSANYRDMTTKRIDVIDMACEEYSQEVLGFYDTISSGNPTLFYDPIVSVTSSTLTPFRNSDFLLEDVDAFLAIEDEPTSSKFHQPYLDPEGDILLLEAFLNDDPSLSPPNQRNYLPEVRKELKICEAKTDKSSVDEPPVVELKALPLHHEYAFLEGDDKLSVIIAKDLSVEEKTTLLNVLNPTSEPSLGSFLISRRCMMEIFHDMIEKTMEVFMDDFSVFGNSFQSCLPHLEKMLKRCEDTNLCLNWEKSHFMVKEGIVLGHKISKQGIEVDKAKVDVIYKLPHPTTVKGIRSFLGHAGFYRCFIKDFSKIARPMTRFLEKDTPFIFSQKYVDSFQTLKMKLTESPILTAPDWDIPFELMCDASDFAIGAVLWQRQDKHLVKNKQEKDKIETKPDQIKKKQEAWKSPIVSKTNHSQDIRKKKKIQSPGPKLTNPRSCIIKEKRQGLIV